MTTVGYGDRYPVTLEGRIVGGLLMIIGVGLFGVLTGLFASWFVKPHSPAEHESLKRLEAEMVLLRRDVAALAAFAETSRQS